MYSLGYLAHPSPNFIGWGKSPKCGFDFSLHSFRNEATMSLQLPSNSTLSQPRLDSPISSQIRICWRLVAIWHVTLTFDHFTFNTRLSIVSAVTWSNCTKFCEINQSAAESLWYKDWQFAAVSHHGLRRAQVDFNIRVPSRTHLPNFSKFRLSEAELFLRKTRVKKKLQFIRDGVRTTPNFGKWDTDPSSQMCVGFTLLLFGTRWPPSPNLDKCRTCWLPVKLGWAKCLGHSCFTWRFGFRHVDPCRN